MRDSSGDETSEPKVKKKKTKRRRKNHSSSDDDEDDDEDHQKPTTALLPLKDETTEEETTDYSYTYQEEKDITTGTEQPLRSTVVNFMDLERQHIPDYTSMESFTEDDIKDDKFPESEENSKFPFRNTSTTPVMFFVQDLTHRPTISSQKTAFGSKLQQFPEGSSSSIDSEIREKQLSVPKLDLSEIASSTGFSVAYTEENETTRTKSTGRSASDISERNLQKLRNRFRDKQKTDSGYWRQVKDYYRKADKTNVEETIDNRMSIGSLVSLLFKKVCKFYAC